jgi:serine protease Do
MAAVGEPAEVIIWRDRRERALRVTVGERERTLMKLSAPASEDRRDPSGLLRRPNRPSAGPAFVMGMELATLNGELARRIEFPESWRGALVLAIDPESPLARHVKLHDVISAIDNQVIQSAEQAVTILNQRGDHLQLVLSLDRLADGTMERHTVRVP